MRHAEVWKNLCIFPAQASLEPVMEELFSVLLLGVRLLDSRDLFHLCSLMLGMCVTNNTESSPEMKINFLPVGRQR